MCIRDSYKGLPVSAQVVMNLISPLLVKGYCLTMDSYYNSPQLADILVQNMTDMYGTVDTERHTTTKIKKKIIIIKREIVL